MRSGIGLLSEAGVLDATRVPNDESGMIAATPTNVSYWMWLKKVLDSHLRQTWDNESSEIQEREDEELNELWTDLDEKHKQRLWGLSADLHTLRDRETCVDSDWPAMTEQALKAAQKDAFQRKAWDKLLECLRRPPRMHPRDMVDYVRGRAWMEMGHPEVAVLFFDNASRLAPENPNYRPLALECLKAIGDWPEILRRSETYRQDPNTPARLLLRTADAMYLLAEETGEERNYREALSIVEEGFRRLQLPHHQEQLPSVLAAAFVTKSLCLSHLGERETAVEVLDEAVRRFPDNPVLLAARGLLKEAIDLGGAAEDFQKAVNHGTSVAWAYVQLARYRLQSGRYDEARELCDAGLACAQEGSAQAALFELRAIARMQQEPPSVVRADFQTASELDPLNEEIQVNLDLFNRYAGNPGAGLPEWRLSAIAPAVAFSEVRVQLRFAA